MLKKVTTLVVVLLLLLATAQLALAQQDTAPTQSVDATQQDTGGTQTSGVGQGTAADPAGQNADQTQPASGSQDPLPNTAGLMRLNPNNDLVVDCAAVSGKLAQLEAAPANDPQSQATLARAEDLSQLCADSGFTPANTSGGANNGSSSNNTGSTQQSQNTSSGG